MIDAPATSRGRRGDVTRPTPAYRRARSLEAELVYLAADRTYWREVALAQSEAMARLHRAAADKGRA